MAEDKRKRMLRYLHDAYTMAVGGVMSLKDLRVVLIDDSSKAEVDATIPVGKRQADRLRDRLLALSGDKWEPKAVVNSLFAKSSNLANIFHDREDKQTQNLIKAYGLTCFEIGTYTSLRAYAIGDFETAHLADIAIAEEQRATEVFERMISPAAVSAVSRRQESSSAKSDGRAGITRAALILPGAILAVWGVSKLLDRQNANEFATSTNRGSPYNADSSAAEPEFVTTEVVHETNCVPTSIQDDAGRTLRERHFA